MDDTMQNPESTPEATPPESNAPEGPSMEQAPKKSSKGLIIAIVVVIIIIAAVIVSTQTDLLKGTVEVSSRATQQVNEKKENYLRELEAAKSIEAENAAEEKFLREATDILDAGR